jgi:thiamine-monophosphate kinase
MAREFGLDPTVCALSGGEDYELLFTISQNDFEKLQGVLLVSVIGHMTDTAEGIVMIDKSGGQHDMKAQGWKSF